MTENQPEKIEKKPEPIGKRLKELIDYFHLNMNSLSTRLKMPSNSIITRIVKNPKRGMSLDLIQKILSEFRGINADWFVMGRGEMVTDKEVEDKPGMSAELKTQLAQKDETIRDLRVTIKAKDETISAKDDLNANLEGRDMLRERDASG